MNGIEIATNIKNPDGIRGYPANVRSMFIATFTALCLFYLFLLLKFLLNLLSGRMGMRGGGGGGAGGYEGFRKSRKKSMGISSVPPVPPPAAPGQETMQTSGVGMGTVGAGYGGSFVSNLFGGGGGDDDYNDQTQGIETEKGHFRDSKYSQALSRAADVSRLGFIILLGGTTLNAWSFDASGAANALAWITFGLITIWAVLALLTASRLLPMIMSLLVIGVAIAFYAVGFSISSGPLHTSEI